MITRTVTGETQHGEPYVALHRVDDDTLRYTMILKAYVSPDGAKIRIVLPELVDFTQTLIDPDKHLLEFDRKPSKRRLR